jgi:hypothetical protein
MNFKETHPRISLNTGKDLSSATNPEIHYEKPDGTTGEWTAVISGQNVEYQIKDTDLDQSGRWIFQAAVAFGSSVQKGTIITVVINNPIKTT